MGSKIINLGSLLVTFLDFWASFWGFGTSWERFGDGIDFWPFSARINHPFGASFWHPKSQKSHETSKKTVSRKQCRKNVLPEVDRIGPMCDPYRKYHMFREVKKCQFGWLLASFWLRFGVTLDHILQTVAIRDLKKRINKNV